jgi:hypothetical protein
MVDRIQGQNWQDVQDAALPIIGTPARSTDEVIMSSIDRHLDTPLRLSVNSPVARVVNIGSIGVVSGDLRNKAIPPIGALLPAYPGTSFTLPAASGGNIDFGGGNTYPLTLGVGLYVYILVYINAAGGNGVVIGVPDATPANLVVPPPVPGTFSIGLVRAHNVAGVIQNLSNEDLTQFVGGGGSGGGGGAGGSSIVETFKNMALDMPYELLTPVVFDTDEDDFVDATSTGVFSVVTRMFEFLAASSTLVSKQLLDQVEFIADGQDVGQIDLVAVWTPGHVDTAAVYQASRNGGANWETITMERIGNATDTFIGRLIFSDAYADTSDLRIKITSSAESSLEAFGVYYMNTDPGVAITGMKNFEVQTFNSNTEKLSPCEFVMTRFIPDPDMLLVVCDGRTYQYGDFAIDGYKITFPDRFFETPDSKTMFIRFMHVGAGSFDNADMNANLMATNHLGSTDLNLDRSLPGRGIIQQAPNGSKYEVGVDNTGARTSTLVV